MDTQRLLPGVPKRILATRNPQLILDWTYRPSLEALVLADPKPEWIEFVADIWLPEFPEFVEEVLEIQTSWSDMRNWTWDGQHRSSAKLPCRLLPTFDTHATSGAYYEELFGKTQRIKGYKLSLPQTLAIRESFIFAIALAIRAGLLTHWALYVGGKSWTGSDVKYYEYNY